MGIGMYVRACLDSHCSGIEVYEVIVSESSNLDVRESRTQEKFPNFTLVRAPQVASLARDLLIQTNPKRLPPNIAYTLHHGINTRNRIGHRRHCLPGTSLRTTPSPSKPFHHEWTPPPHLRRPNLSLAIRWLTYHTGESRISCTAKK